MYGPNVHTPVVVPSWSGVLIFSARVFMFGGVVAVALGLADESGNDNTTFLLCLIVDPPLEGVSGESPAWSSRIGDIDACGSCFLLGGST